MWHKNVSRFDNNRFVITDTYCIAYECSNGVCEHVRLWRQNGSRFFSSRTESIFLFIVTLVADTSGNDKAFTCCVWSVTLSKSNGCVKHAAPPLANPPKYHRDCRVCATFDDISSLLLSVSRSQSSLRENNCKKKSGCFKRSSVKSAWNLDDVCLRMSRLAFTRLSRIFSKKFRTLFSVDETIKCFRVWNVYRKDSETPTKRPIIVQYTVQSTWIFHAHINSIEQSVKHATSFKLPQKYLYNILWICLIFASSLSVDLSGVYF